MPTLREFVTDVLQQSGIQSDADEIIKQITDIARERAENNVAAISDEEVREMVINNAELAQKLAREKEAKAEAEAQRRIEEERLKAEQKAEQQRIKEEERTAKRIEKERKRAEGEQLALF